MDCFYAPKNWCWVSLSGPDSGDFLHRMSSGAVRELQIGEGTRGCFLSGKGKLRGYFSIWRIDQEDYALEFDGGEDGSWKKRILDFIELYTFGENFSVTDVSGPKKLETVWLLPKPKEKPSFEIPEPWSSLANDDEARINHHGELDFGRPLLTVWATPGRLLKIKDEYLSQSEEINPATLNDWRISRLRPKLDQEITEDVIPLEIGLIDGVARGKGCYPGQEVTEKIFTYGSPSRRLAKIQGNGTSPRLEEKVQNLAAPPAEVGKVTSLQANESGFTVLAYVRKIHAKEGLEVQFESGAKGKIVEIAPFQ